jgi:hypothetical protein
MIDKLSLTSPNSIDLDVTWQKLKGLYSEHKSTASKYHHKILVMYKEGEHLLSLHTQPKFYNINETKIELNPSRFKGYADLTALLSEIEEPSNLRVSRIDHCVDVPVPIKAIASSLICSRKKRRRDYANGIDLSTFYLGAYPEMICVYDKARQAKLEGVLTRVEVRQHAEKVPFSNYEALPQLLDYNPFKSFQFSKVKALDEIPAKKQDKAKFLQSVFNEETAQAAFKKLNKCSNFKRDFADLLETSTQIPDLLGLYRQQIQKFFSLEVK